MLGGCRLKGPIAATAALCAIILAAYWLGGRENRAIDKLSDKEGAENVQTITQETLGGIPDDADPIDLLNDTNGLRD